MLFTDVFSNPSRDEDEPHPPYTMIALAEQTRLGVKAYGGRPNARFPTKIHGMVSFLPIGNET